MRGDATPHHTLKTDVKVSPQRGCREEGGEKNRSSKNSEQRATDDDGLERGVFGHEATAPESRSVDPQFIYYSPFKSLFTKII